MKTSFKIISGCPPEEGFGEPLAGLPVGARGHVASVGASGTERARLEAMGLCEGRVVEVVKSGDPLIVRVLGTRIGLAAVLAECVRVERDPSALRPPAAV